MRSNSPDEGSDPSASKPGDAGLSRVGNELEVGYDSKFEDQWQRFQLVCWIALIIFVAAAVSGLLGRGAATHAQLTNADGSLTVKYDKVVHFRTPAEVTVNVAPRAIQNNIARVWISNSFYTKFQLQRVLPEPREATRDGNGTLLSFLVAPGSAATVSLRLEPSSVGIYKTEVRVPGHPPAQFQSLVLP